MKGVKVRVQPLVVGMLSVQSAMTPRLPQNPKIATIKRNMVCRPMVRRGKKRKDRQALWEGLMKHDKEVESSQMSSEKAKSEMC